MIKSENSTELEKVFQKLDYSFLTFLEYKTICEEYESKIYLTKKDERELLKILQNKYQLPISFLKYDVNILEQNPYFKNIKLGDI